MTGSFVHEGDGVTYRISERSQTQIYVNGHHSAIACLQLSIPAPGCDRMIAEYLILKNDERLYWNLANVLPLETTRFDYDAFGNVTKVTYPSGAFETFTYDNAGRLATKVDRKGVTTTYTYDADGRLTGKSYKVGGTPVNYGYDADGHLIGRCRGAINGAHGLSGDAEGNLYLAELPPQEITKLERIA